jgi:hypothetical protein
MARKSNPWNNPLTPEHKAIALAARVLSEDSPHKFPPGMGGPVFDLSGVTLDDAIAVVKGMTERCENPARRKGLKANLATLRQKRALRASA